MRPLLKLKKTLQAPESQPPEVAAAANPTALIQPPVLAQTTPPAKPAKPARPAQQALEKERIRQENIRLAALAWARRREQMATVVPLLEAYLASKAAWTVLVVLEGEGYFRPLCIGLNKVLLAWLRAQPQALGCSSTVLSDAVAGAVKSHVNQPQYSAGILKFNERFDLDGNPAGVVSPKEKAHAARKLGRLKSPHEPAPADAMAPT